MKDKIKKYSLHWALGGKDANGGLEQNAYELEKLCEFINEKNIKTYTEIGCAAGQLLRFMRDEFELDATGITLEPRDTHKDLPIIHGSSRDPEIIKMAKPCDLYFIDGDHSYLGVKSDYLNYKGLCKYMAFHDILGQRDCEGVSQFWNEIRNEYEFIEFIDPNRDIASGIGIIKII